MAKKKTEDLSGEKRTVTLFYDGEKYKDDLFVGINGKTWQIRRGEPVEVPVEVYEVLMNSEEQDRKAARLSRDLSRQAQEFINL